MKPTILVVEKDTMNCTWGFKLWDIDPLDAVIIRGIVSNNWMDSEDYKATRLSHPFLQGYDEDKIGSWVYVESMSGNKSAFEEFVEYVRGRLADPVHRQAMREMYDL